MSSLFEKTSIKSIELDNRSIRSATWSGVADKRGFVTVLAMSFYGRLSMGASISFFQGPPTAGPMRMAETLPGATASLASKLAPGAGRQPGGMVPSRTPMVREEDEAYLAQLAGLFEEKVSVPVVTVGGVSVSTRDFPNSLQGLGISCKVQRKQKERGGRM